MSFVYIYLSQVSMIFFLLFHLLLPPVEIIKEVEKEGDNLTDLLRVRNDDLEKDCLERALTAAVRTGNHFNVGKLIVKGATNIQAALQQAVDNKKYHAVAMLLLVIAAMNGNKQLVLKLFVEFSGNVPLPEGIVIPDDDFREVQKAVTSGQVSTVVPIEIARRKGQPGVREELLLRTDVKPEEGTVYWHGLRLLNIELSWIRKIYWVKKLRLARNGFRYIPSEIGQHLKLVS